MMVIMMIIIITCAVCPQSLNVKELAKKTMKKAAQVVPVQKDAANWVQDMSSKLINEPTYINSIL